MTQNKSINTSAALKSFCGSSTSRSLGEPLHVSLGPVLNDRARGTERQIFYAFSRSAVAFDGVFSKPGSHGSSPASWQRPEETLPNTRATEPLWDLNKCFWNRCFLVKRKKKKGDDTVAVLVLDVMMLRGKQGPKMKQQQKEV